MMGLEKMEELIFTGQKELERETSGRKELQLSIRKLNKDMADLEMDLVERSELLEEKSEKSQELL